MMGVPALFALQLEIMSKEQEIQPEDRKLWPYLVLVFCARFPSKGGGGDTHFLFPGCVIYSITLCQNLTDHVCCTRCIAYPARARETIIHKCVLYKTSITEQKYTGMVYDTLKYS